MVAKRTHTLSDHGLAESQNPVFETPACSFSKLVNKSIAKVLVKDEGMDVILLFCLTLNSRRNMDGQDRQDGILRPGTLTSKGFHTSC